MTWWSKTFDINIPIDVTSVLFGIPNFGNDKVLYFMNFCLIYAKWYIYCSKKKEEKMFFLNFVFMLKNVLQTEQVRSQINDDQTFEKKLLEFYEQM